MSVRLCVSRSYGSKAAEACTVPGTHLKYVLAAASEADSCEWQEAFEAHIAFASSEAGEAAHTRVFEARESTRAARLAALAQGPPTAVEEPEQRRRCEARISGPGTPAVLCDACGDGDGASRCVACLAPNCDDDDPHMIIRSGIVCDQCCAAGAEVCCRCDARVGALRVRALLCVACGGGERAASCCKHLRV